MAVKKTLSIDEFINLNEVSSAWVSECISGLNNLPSSKTLKFEKKENDLASDNSYHNNNSIEFVEKSGIDIIKYLKHMLNNCLDQAHSISGYQLEALELIYDFENPVEIYAYLNNKDELINFLLKAAEKINEFFTDSMQLTIVKKSDPEIEDFDYLTVFINTSELSVAEARNKFKKFKYEWYFEHSDDLDGRIVFHVT